MKNDSIQSNNNLSFPTWDLDYNMLYDLAIQGKLKCKKSYLRILNTYAKSSIDVQINEILMGENLSLGAFSPYVKFKSGEYDITMHDSNSKKMIYKSKIRLDNNLVYTGVLSQDDLDKEDISVLMIPEAKDRDISGKNSSIKLTNLISDTKNLILTTHDNVVLFSGIGYGDVSDNIVIPSGKYSLNLVNKLDEDVILKVDDVDFAPRMHYTIFLAGNTKENQQAKLIIPEDGVNYLEIY